ncbi:MAG: ATP-binding cassette domain-containing protein [Anaerolineales bacterium]|nr:ATP-binding cassette domain-containing protein [Anaerolineales bacterium]
MLLEVKDVSLTIDDELILSQLNLEVPAGDIHSLLGVNGVGKSTLASLLMGLKGMRPDRGNIHFNGADITQASITDRAKLGMTLAWQAPASFSGLTVRDYLSISSRASGEDVDIQECLKMVGLAPSKYIDRFVDDHLSGGERRRVELAAVVSMNPRMAILDEPDSGIDFLSLDEITNVIRHLSMRGTAVLLITHREEMALMANQASLMCAGSVVASGEPHAVTDYYRYHCDVCTHPNLPDLVRIANDL